ncbi:MAG: hypothetical protein KBA52_03960 [Candidatus Kapabacteria bacterium]|jgi:hypothetical protein|nr:hypothetical protein [Candidatus Kapabacteria bacterium]
MKKLLIVLLMSVLPIVFWSCSDDDDNNPVNPAVKNYFPLSVGSYWVYEKYTLDSNNNRISTSLVVDSAYCKSTAQEIINDVTQNIYTLAHFSSNLTNPDQEFYVYNDQIYQKYQLAPGIDLSAFGVNVNDYLNLDWMLLIDQKNSSWISYPQKSLELPAISFPNVGDVILTLILKLDGTSKGDGSYVLNNKPISTKDYELDWTVSGTAKIPSLGAIGSAIPIPEFKLQTIYKLADGIGIVNIVTDSQKVSILNLISFQFPGSEQNLIRYNIAK